MPRAPILMFDAVAIEVSDSSSLFELPLFPPDMFSIADVAAVNGCSKYLHRREERKNEKISGPIHLGRGENIKGPNSN